MLDMTPTCAVAAMRRSRNIWREARPQAMSGTSGGMVPLGKIERGLKCSRCLSKGGRMVVLLPPPPGT